jgi:hypothetical protein
MWITACPRCKVLVQTFRLRGACYALLVVVLTAGISAQISPPASNLPSDQQVLTFLTESIDWYRHSAAEEQLATARGAERPTLQAALGVLKTSHEAFPS